MPLTAGLVLGAVSGGIKIWNGIKQKKAGDRLAAGNRRPRYSIPLEYYNNQSLMENQAQSGLGAPSLDYNRRMNDRGLSAGLDATLQAGGSVNNLAKLYDTYDVNNARTASEDSQLRTQHIAGLIDANKDLAGQRSQEWALNEYEPYKDTAREASALKGAGDTNFSSGISGVGSALSSFGTAHNYDQLLDTGGGTPRGANITGVNTPMNIDGTSPALNTQTNLFGTPGGQDVMRQMSNGNPNSPYMQALLKALNRPN